MKQTLDDLLIRFQSNDASALPEIIKVFEPTIKFLIKNEYRESFFTYYDTLITDLVISIYNLNTNTILNKKAYLNACLKNSFIKFNSSCISTTLLPSNYDLYSFDNYSIYLNNTSEYLDILRNYLTLKELELLDLRFIENVSIKNLSKLYNVSESDIYKRLKKLKIKLSTNPSLKKDLYDNLIAN